MEKKPTINSGREGLGSWKIAIGRVGHVSDYVITPSRKGG